MALLTLPPEILEAMLHNLDGKTLCRAKQVCRAIADVIHSSLLLQLNIELAGAGLVKANTPGHCLAADIGELTLAEQLARVRRYRKAWHDLDFLPPRRLESDSDRWAPWGPRFHESGLFIKPLSTGAIECLQLSSPLGVQKDLRWAIPAENLPDGLNLVRYAVDPSQDLLVLLFEPSGNADGGLQYLAFRSLRTGRLHPLASPEHILVGDKFSSDWSDREMHIYHDLVMLVHRMSIDSTHVLVCNWKAGILLSEPRFPVDDPNDSVLPEVSFMWNHILLVSPAYVSVYSATGTPEVYTPILICRLRLPPKQQVPKLAYCVEISCHTPLPHTTFCRLDPDEEIVLLTITYSPGISHDINLCIALRRPALLDLVDRVERGDHPPTFDWSEWGPLSSVSPWDGACNPPSLALGGLRSALVWPPPDPGTDGGPPQRTEIHVLEFGTTAATPGRSTVYMQDSGEELDSSPFSAGRYTYRQHIEILWGMPPPSFSTRTRMWRSEGDELGTSRSPYVWENGVVLMDVGTDAVMSLRS